MTGVTYLLATRSTGKLRELRELFSSRGVRVIDLNEAGIPESAEEEAIEAFDTFEANARAKSEYFHRLSGLPTFADDSGLVVHALGGAPGVRSKRWSAEIGATGAALDAANNAKLLSELLARGSDVDMSAEYVCAASFTDASGTRVRVGRTSGQIYETPQGTQGFGYDPYFLSDELGKTFGEATAMEKEKVSHRGRAFTALVAEVCT
jgi:XTP/dITP diphosphohydrolase